MKNGSYIVTLLVILLSSYSFSQNQQDVNLNGYNVFYYENGKISSEGTMRDGKPDGYWKTYYQSGKIKSEGNRKNFQLDSLWKFYTENGLLTSEINYSNSKKQGIKTTWSEHNYILQEENFIADVKQGFSYTYYEPKDSLFKGKLKTKINFDKGRENGTAYEYSEDGIIIAIYEYKFGVLTHQQEINRVDRNGDKQGVWKDFYNNGKVKSEISYLNGKKNGYSKTYTEAGALIDLEKYAMDSAQVNAPELTPKLEVRNEYYTTGQIKKTCTYFNGLAEGTQKEYSEEGKIVAAKFFKEGNLVGEGLIDEAGNQQGKWKEYHLTGQLKGEGDYIDGKRVGEWVFYYPNGKLEQKGRYDKKGRAQDMWKWYYENGLPLREEIYLNGKREGTMTEWSDSGKVITKGEYIDGNKEGPWFFQLQDYREEGKYKNDQKDGSWKSYYVDNNKLQFSGSFVEGLPDGKHVHYFHDGKVSEEGKYIVGNKQGNWAYYNPDGTILITISYKDGREIKFDGTKVKPALPGESFK